MINKKAKIKSFLFNCEGQIDSQFIHVKFGVSRATARKYLAEFADETGLLRIPRGREAVYIRKERKPFDIDQIQDILPKLHNVVLHIPLQKSGGEGGLLKAFKYCKDDRFIGVFLEYYLGKEITLDHYNSHTKGKTCIEGRLKEPDNFRSIRYQLSWSDTTQKEYGSPAITFWISCTNNPLDPKGIDWVNHELLTSFNIDVMKHENAIIRQYGVATDHILDGKLTENTCNIRYEDLSGLVVEYYKKEFPDGSQCLRKGFHENPDFLRAKELFSLAYSAKNMPNILETNQTLIHVVNGLVRTFTKMNQSMNQMVQHFDIMTREFNQNKERFDRITREFYS